MARVGAAAADIAGQRLPAVLSGRVGVFVQESLGRNHEARRAVAALHGVPLAVGVDQGLPLGIGRDALDGLDRLALAFHGEGAAGKNGPAVDDDGAGAAHAPVAHVLGPGEAELELQGALQGPVGLDQDFAILPVDMEFGRDRDDRIGMIGAEVVLQVREAAVVFAADGAAELGDGRGHGVDGLGRRGRSLRQGYAGPEGAAGDDHSRALEEIPAVQASSFAFVGCFVRHEKSS